MSIGRGIAALAGTVAVAAVVAYAVSAPRNADNFMAQEQASLGGKSINETMAEAQADAKRQQCAQYTRAAEDAWNRAMEQGTADRDAARLDELDSQVARFCNT
ncbi:hypothetical protein [Altererythrobacter lauratis]